MPESRSRATRLRRSINFWMILNFGRAIEKTMMIRASMISTASAMIHHMDEPLPNAPDHAADTQDGRVEDHADHHHGHHLDLGDVVGGARDQRRSGKILKFGA